MVNYNTNLKSWGDSGQEPPDGYNYVVDEPPVDVWDNWFNYNVISDIDHLISLTNSRIEADKGASGNEPPSPEESHLYHDQDNDRLELWDGSSSSWRGLAYESELNSDSDIVSVVDAEVDNAASSVAGLDDEVASLQSAITDEQFGRTVSTNQTITNSEGRIVAGDYTVDATLTVDGLLENTSPGTLGKVSGSGTVKGSGVIR